MLCKIITNPHDYDKIYFLQKKMKKIYVLNILIYQVFIMSCMLLSCTTHKLFIIHWHVLRIICMLWIVEKHHLQSLNLECVLFFFLTFFLFFSFFFFDLSNEAMELVCLFVWFSKWGSGICLATHKPKVL